MARCSPEKLCTIIMNSRACVPATKIALTLDATRAMIEPGEYGVFVVFLGF